jgi:hypothetical protein
LPSGLVVIAEESRSQHENRARALRRLRQAIYLHIRESLPASTLTPEVIAHHPIYKDARGANGRLRLGRKDDRYWPVAGLVLDILDAQGGRLRDAAAILGISTANLVEFLQSDPKIWEQAAHTRARFGLKPLHG